MTPIKSHAQLAFEAEKAHRYREAALHWQHARQICKDDKVRERYTKMMVRCEMAYTRRLLDLNR